MQDQKRAAPDAECARLLPAMARSGLGSIDQASQYVGSSLAL